MDRPGAYVLGNVVGVNNEGRPVYEGMPEGQLPEGLRGYFPQDAEVSIPALPMISATRSFTAIDISLPVSMATYVNSGLMAMARFAGRVHGVVVQMSMDMGLSGYL